MTEEIELDEEQQKIINASVETLSEVMQTHNGTQLRIMMEIIWATYFVVRNELVDLCKDKELDDSVVHAFMQELAGGVNSKPVHASVVLKHIKHKLVPFLKDRRTKVYGEPRKLKGLDTDEQAGVDGDDGGAAGAEAPGDAEQGG